MFSLFILCPLFVSTMQQRRLFVLFVLVELLGSFFFFY